MSLTKNCQKIIILETYIGTRNQLVGAIFEAIWGGAVHLNWYPDNLTRENTPKTQKVTLSTISV